MLLTGYQDHTYGHGRHTKDQRHTEEDKENRSGENNHLESDLQESANDIQKPSAVRDGRVHLPPEKGKTRKQWRTSIKRNP
jgi:hypothetical protein